jgi:electron transfer flavoprotein alpha subunit
MTAEQLELITAAVDGELSATESRAFRRLLETSPEARAMFSKLEADSVRVRALPRATPPADLRAKILAKLAAITPAPVAKPAEPARPVQPVPARGAPSWLPVAIAAGVLLCITAGSFAFFASDSGSGKGSTAKAPWSNALPAIPDAPVAMPSPIATPREPVRIDPNAVAHSDVSPVPPLPVQKVVTPDPLAVAPAPRVIEPDLIAGGVFPTLRPFDFARVRVPFLRALSELEREDRRQELTDELLRDPAFRIDLFVRDTARGVEIFQSAAKASGLTVFADATALDRLKKKQVASVVIYTESLTAAELADLFAKLCAEDAKFSPRVCDVLHAAPVVRSDELDLRATLGFDAGLFKRPVGSGGTAQSTKTPDKPVSANTIDSVVKSVTNASDKTAVLMTWHPASARTNPTMSAEVKQFQSKRADRKPNSLPAIIVIRPIG